MASCPQYSGWPFGETCSGLGECVSSRCVCKDGWAGQGDFTDADGWDCYFPHDLMRMWEAFLLCVGAFQMVMSVTMGIRRLLLDIAHPPHTGGSTHKATPLGFGSGFSWLWHAYHRANSTTFMALMFALSGLTQVAQHGLKLSSGQHYYVHLSVSLVRVINIAVSHFAGGLFLFITFVRSVCSPTLLNDDGKRMRFWGCFIFGFWIFSTIMPAVQTILVFTSSSQAVNVPSVRTRHLVHYQVCVACLLGYAGFLVYFSRELQSLLRRVVANEQTAQLMRRVRFLTRWMLTVCCVYSVLFMLTWLPAFRVRVFAIDAFIHFTGSLQVLVMILSLWNPPNRPSANQDQQTGDDQPIKMSVSSTVLSKSGEKGARRSSTASESRSSMAAGRRCSFPARASAYAHTRSSSTSDAVHSRNNSINPKPVPTPNANPPANPDPDVKVAVHSADNVAVNVNNNSNGCEKGMLARATAESNPYPPPNGLRRSNSNSRRSSTAAAAAATAAASEPLVGSAGSTSTAWDDHPRQSDAASGRGEKEGSVSFAGLKVVPTQSPAPVTRAVSRISLSCFTQPPDGAHAGPGVGTGAQAQRAPEARQREQQRQEQLLSSPTGPAGGEFVQPPNMVVDDDSTTHALP